MIIPVFIPHLGCPHTCIFCNQRTISGQKTSGLEAARAQIEKYLAWARPGEQQELAFYGGSFTALPLATQKELLELAQSYVQQGVVSSLRLSTRPDALSSEIIEQLVHYGVQTVELGVQSFDPQVLALAERGHSAEVVATAVAQLRAAKLRVGLQLMVGLPGQTQASLELSLQQTLQLAPALVRIYPVLVIQGTKLAKMYEQGQYLPLDLETAVKQTSLLYEALTAAGITVIRMGLQMDAELCRPGNILAGPFHPAFGELVKAYGYRERVASYIRSLPEGAKSLTITHPAALSSIIRGQHRANVLYWQSLRELEINFIIGEKFVLSAG